jgi:hypothetical protein
MRFIAQELPFTCFACCSGNPQEVLSTPLKCSVVINRAFVLSGTIANVEK